MTSGLSSLFTAPSAFFAAHEENPGRIGPVVVVALTGAITLAAQLLLVSMSVIGRQPTIEYVTHTVQIQLPALSVAGAAFSFGHVFGYWIAYSLLFSFVSGLFSSNGDFRTVFWLTGWGFLPWALGGVFWLGAMIVSANSTSAPMMAAGNEAFIRQVQAATIVRVTQYLDHIAVIWSLGLWTVLIKKIREVETWQAIAAVIPVAVFEFGKVLFLF